MPAQETHLGLKTSPLTRLRRQRTPASAPSVASRVSSNEELSKMVQGGVPFPMLSDGGGRIGTIYGVYDEDAGVDIRGRFIIDPDFVIRAMEVLTPEVGRNPDELLRQVQQFPF